MGSEKTCTQTLFSPGVLQCSQGSVNVCRRRSLHLRLHLSRLKLSPLQRESIQFGLVDRFLHRYQPSKVCGSVRRNTMSQVLPLFIVNVFKSLVFTFFYVPVSRNYSEIFL